jgi:hypothetical protein
MSANEDQPIVASPTLRVVRLNEDDHDHDPLPSGAYAVGARILAARWGLDLPDGATLLVTDRAAIGQYGLAELHGGPGDRVWMASARALEEALVMGAEADLARDGVGLDEESFERRAARLLRRRLAHFPPELLDQVVEQIPRLVALLARDPFGDERP